MIKYVFISLFIPLISFSQDCDLFSNENCLVNKDNYYFFEKILIDDDCDDYKLDNKERLNLKNDLSQSIISFIKNKSSLALSYKKDNKEFSDTKIFNSLSQSNSSAILFNPRFLTCKSKKNEIDVNSVFVYLEKKDFNQLAINYFKSLTQRTKNNILLYNSKFRNDPGYDFFEELINLESSISTLSSYFGLMISLNLEDEYKSDFFKLEADTKSFMQKINSFENLIDSSDFKEAFVLLTKFNTIFRNPYTRDKIDLQINRYNQFVKVAKSNKLQEFKNNSISFNEFSLGLVMNSALINNFKGGDGTLNYNSNSTFDRLFPSVQSSFVFNTREHKYGFGPYFKYNFSNAIIPLNNKEYFSPFSNSFSEVGVFAQYFFIKDFSDESMAAITFSAGKMIENFMTETGENLNFFTISPGFKTYLQTNSTKRFRTSLSLQYNIIVAKKEYTYSNFSLSLSINRKVGQKISEKEKNKLDNDFKIFK